ncbi:hypothetical protein HZ994_02130 [Akkermansiaceae bacterium]|nr:hypothetical protein HZ994_02130 [Akkermansiaceae bacterium]
MSIETLDSTSHDNSFEGIQGLSWLPWVGLKYSTLPAQERLLIIGESHYANENEASANHEKIGELMKNSRYTREIVGGALVKLENWTTPTLTNLHLLLHAHKPVDRKVFWSNACFYNFVQRPMDYTRRERPGRKDFVDGWKVFTELSRVLRPSHCLFIGVGASNVFNPAAKQMGIDFEPALWTEMVSGTWGRKAALGTNGNRIEMTFIQHAGAPRFSWCKWHDYLNRDRAELMAVVNRAASPAI